MVAVENEGDENASLYLDRIDEPHARRTLRAATAHRRCAHAAARGFPRAAPASAHLGKLVEAKLLVVEKQGRHRYFRLTSPKVAGVIEALMAVAVDGAPRHRPRSRGDEALALARTCYDHLAGRLGVALADTLIERGHVVLDDDGGLVTTEGTRFLSEFGLDLSDVASRQRRFCRPCLDWSERRRHLGGAVGVALARQCFKLGWIERVKDSRAVAITSTGRSGLLAVFGIAITDPGMLAQGGANDARNS
jgi:DNA-binding transcriptional ArsR family regulator